MGKKNPTLTRYHLPGEHDQEDHGNWADGFGGSSHESVRNKDFYHGTDIDFPTFDMAKSKAFGKFGHWFTDDESLAGNFGKNTKVARLDIRNPKIITTKQWNDIREAHAKDAAWFGAWKRQLRGQGFDGLFVRGGKEKLGRFDVINPNIVAVFDDVQIKTR